MRRQVPFMGEQRIARTGDEAETKKAKGQVIDDVLSTQRQPSTWDDEVFAPPPEPPMRAHVPAPKRPKQEFKKAIIEATTTFSDSSVRLDWLLINNGHGLRINVAGRLDQNAREEWRRMLDETASTGVGQFEFNLTQASALSLTGLGMLLSFKEKKGSARGDIKLCHCNKDVWQILQWTGMDKYFVIQGGPEG